MSGIHQMLLSAKPPPPARVTISNQSIFDSTFGFSVAKYDLGSNGQARYYRETDGGYTNITGEWLISGVVTDYEIRWNQTGGLGAPIVDRGPAENVWGSGGAPDFGLELRLTSTTGSDNADVLVEIRDAVTFIPLDSAAISLNVDGQL